MATESKIKEINYGFVPSKIEQDHYVLGASSIPKIILQPLGNWEQYLPSYEPQFDEFETYGCTVWGTQNAIETLIKRMEAVEPNYSERFTYILAGVREPGADPHKIAEIIRNDGLIDHELLPNNTSTYEEFIKPSPMTKELVDEGEKWLNKYDFKHEWVFTNNPDKQTRLTLLKEALQYSPVCLSVTAWSSDANGLYYAYNNAPNNHWVMCYGIEGESLLVFDTYDQSKKKLHPDHPIMMAKRYYIGASTRQEQLGIIEKIIKLLGQWLGLIKSNTPPVSPKLPLVETLPIKPVEARDLLQEFCLAIQEYEGFFKGSRSERNNNPFNLRFIGQGKAIGKDDKGFARFQTYKDGFDTGKQMIFRACSGQSKVYYPEMTITQFFGKYAPSNDGNDPDRYAKWICAKLKIPTTTQIKTLIGGKLT